MTSVRSVFWTAVTAWAFILPVWILIKDLYGKGMVDAGMMAIANWAMLGMTCTVALIGAVGLVARLYQRKGNYD